MEIIWKPRVNGKAPHVGHSKEPSEERNFGFPISEDFNVDPSAIDNRLPRYAHLK
jgi:hypothetical protein